MPIKRRDDDLDDYEVNQEAGDDRYELPDSEPADDYAFAGDVHCLFCGELTPDDAQFCNEKCRGAYERRAEDEAAYDAKNNAFDDDASDL
jgi:hypothetical protein